MKPLLSHIYNYTRESLPALLVFNALLVPFIFHVPIFDGREYYNCLMSAALGTFKLQNFICFDHPTLLLIGLYSIPLHLLQGNAAAIHLMTMLLGSISIVALASIFKIFIPEKDWGAVRSLALMIYATHPIIIANAVSFNPDLGVLFFFVAFLACLLRGRDFLAAAFGVFMIFSKEAGLLAYLLTLLLYTVIFIIPRHEVKLNAVSTILKRRWLLLPLMLSGLYVWVKVSMWHGTLFYGVSDGADVLTLSRFYLNRRFYIILTEFFTLQFTWTISLVIILAFLVFLLKFRLRIFNRGFFGLPEKNTLFLVLLIFFGTYIFSRGVNYNNLRYLMLLLPMLILLFAVSLRFIQTDKGPTLSYLLLVLILNGFSIFRSFDPISLKLIGAFPFGSHKIYAMSKVTGDNCCGFGRDQLVYNLEHLKLIDLQEEAFKWIRPRGSTFIGMNESAHWSFSDRIDPQTFKFTEKLYGIQPKFVTADQILISNPQVAYFIEFPNFYNQTDINKLKKSYEFVRNRSFEISGYELNVHQLSRKI